jgi:hypothetical protein
MPSTHRVEMGGSLSHEPVFEALLRGRDLTPSGFLRLGPAGLLPAGLRHRQRRGGLERALAAVHAGRRMTYVSPKSGRQYIVVYAGGPRAWPNRGDYILAYALPKRQ